VHHVGVGHIGVGEDYLFDLVFLDQIHQLFFGVNGDSGGIEPASQFRRVGAPLDIGDLRGGEGDHLVIRVVAEENVEVVKIAPGGAHDQSADW